MVKKLSVSGYKECIDTCKNLSDKDTTVFILFCGSKDENGHSWCPDCVTAEPVIEQALEKAPEDAVFVHCEVGERSYWKDQANDFRKDADFKLTAVPTLLKLGSSQKLVEGQCFEKNLVEMMFEED